MKLKKDFVLRQVAGKWIVIPFGDSTVNFHGMISLNETGAMLWRRMESECDAHALAVALTEEFEIDYEQALMDVNEFIDTLDRAGCIEK